MRGSRGIPPLHEIKEIMAGAYLQILAVYTVVTLLVCSGFAYLSMPNFGIFGLITGMFGLFYVKERYNVRIPLWILILSAGFVAVTRLQPYSGNSIPLGYDPGIYRYIFERYFSTLPGLPVKLEEWINAGYPPGLFVFGDILHITGAGVDDIIKFGQVLMQIMLIPAVYAVSKQQFGRDVAAVSTLLFSASLPQFMVFWHSYYKNMLGMILMLSAIYLYESRRYLPAAILAGFLGGVHRPTFMILVLSLLIHSLVTRRGIVALATPVASGLITLTFYLETYREALLQLIGPLVKTQIGGGTFLSLKAYEMVAVGYLPFGVLGFAYTLLRMKKVSVVSVWFALSAAIVYFKIAFYNRFIIHFDMAMLIFAAYGFILLMRSNRAVGIAAFALLVGSSAWMVHVKADSAEPLISPSEMAAIEALKSTEADAVVVSTSSHYSPWLLGYSGRRVVAPGLFEYDRWSIDEWREFWSTANGSKAAEMLSVYEKPLYLYVGRHSPINLRKFNSECFEVFYSDGNGTAIYRLLC